MNAWVRRSDEQRNGSAYVVIGHEKPVRKPGGGFIALFLFVIPALAQDLKFEISDLRW